MRSMWDLSGRRAAVVGGTGVLGGQFCRALAGAGAEVFVLGRDAERGSAVCEQITSTGGAAHFLPVDVTERESLSTAAEFLCPEGLDILVNAAGVNSRTPFDELSEAEWALVHDTNLGAVFRSCQVFVPLLAGREESASIINVSSASSGPPLSRVFAYGVAKAGVNNLTQYLAREFAPRGVRVNGIIPGFFPAEQNRALLTDDRVQSILNHTPMARLGEPNDLDGALLWLASSQASAFVTGALIPVDGGFSAMTI